MLLLFIAMLLDDWRYGGFAADPAGPEPVVPASVVPAAPARKPATPAPVVPAPATGAPVAPESVGRAPAAAARRTPVPREGGVRDPGEPPPAPPPPPPPPAEEGKPPTAPPPPVPVPGPAPRKPRTIRAEAAPRLTLWRLADRSGQVWEDADPDRLRQWVAYRDASLTAPGPGPWPRVRGAIRTHRISPRLW